MHRVQLKFSLLTPGLHVAYIALLLFTITISRPPLSSSDYFLYIFTAYFLFRLITLLRGQCRQITLTSDAIRFHWLFGSQTLVPFTDLAAFHYSVGVPANSETLTFRRRDGQIYQLKRPCYPRPEWGLFLAAVAERLPDLRDTSRLDRPSFV